VHNFSLAVHENHLKTVGGILLTDRQTNAMGCGYSAVYYLRVLTEVTKDGDVRRTKWL